jgi:hypothetical protein
MIFGGKQINYSPSPHRCSSSALISIRERRSGDSPTALEEETCRGTQQSLCIKHHEVSFGCDIIQSTQILIFPLSLVLVISFEVLVFDEWLRSLTIRGTCDLTVADIENCTTSENSLDLP